MGVIDLALGSRLKSYHKNILINIF